MSDAPTPELPTTDLPPLPSPERLQDLLHQAARLGRDDVIPALLQAGADVDARDVKGYTPLILASYNGQVSTTTVVLAAGATVDAGDGARGNTPLMGVAFKGYADIARLLLEAGADANQRNLAGQTALMNAVMFGHAPIVEMLLAAGAETDVVDAAGNSLASIAAGQSNTAMLDLIDRAVRPSRSDAERADAAPQAQR
nr:ankyrin repeat domain-containing protein [Sphingomonas sp. PAMC 26621]